jgi:hypothetical protein
VHETFGVVGWNQHKDVLYLQRGTWIRAERKPVDTTAGLGASKRGSMQPGPEPYTDEQLAEIDDAYDAEQRRGATPLFWEDVHEGDQLPTIVKGPLRITDVILWHAGFGQAFPTHAFGLARRTRRESPGLYTKNTLNVWDIVQRMHWDADWARKVGAAACYDYGALRETFMAQALSSWSGDDGWLWKLDVQHRRFNHVGDTTWVRGHVAEKFQVGNLQAVKVDIRCENQRGEVTSPGTAVVLLPSKKDGTLEMPSPPAADALAILRGEVERLAAVNVDDEGRR